MAASSVRDERLDLYRVLAMMWVLCVIHVSYWLGMADEPWRSLMLFEMPVIFFIAGASQRYVDLDRPFGALLKSRWRRVIRPFYIYALVCCGIALLWWGLHLGIPAIDGPHPWGGFRREAHFLAALLLGQDSGLLPYLWHLWFIVPYLLLALLFPYEVRLIRKAPYGHYPAMALNIAVVALFYFLPSNPWINPLRQALLYNFFMLCGYFLYGNLHKWTLAGIGIACFCILLIYRYIFGGGYFADAGSQVYRRCVVSGLRVRNALFVGSSGR